MSDANADWLQPPVEQQGLNRYLGTLRERLWIVIATLVIVTGLAVAYVVTADKVYEARAEMLVTPIPADQTIFAGLGLIRESTQPTNDVQTAAQLIDTEAVAARAAAKLDTNPTPQSVLNDVQVDPVPASDIVGVTAQGPTPTAARDLANAFATAAAAQRTAALHARIDRVLPKLQAQLQASSGAAAAAVATQVAQLETLRAGDDPTIRVETPATAPGSPSSPRPLLTIAGGVLAGLVLGIAAAFTIQALDPKLRREEQLRHLYRLPILSRIPRQRHGQSPLAPDQTVPAAREAYRTLRATLGAGAAHSGRRSILVTGSSPSEGKTTTAINLASSLALAGSSVILIEADLRRPSIGKTLGVNPVYGVVSVLIEQVPLADALVSTTAYGPELQLLLADHSGPGIAELLSLPVAQRLVDEAEMLADVVIIDSPPLTEVVDALPLAQRADEVVLIVRLGVSRLNKIRELGELLAGNGVRPAGFAVVGAAANRSGYYYYSSDAGVRGAGGEAPRRLLRRAS